MIKNWVAQRMTVKHYLFRFCQFPRQNHNDFCLKSQFFCDIFYYIKLLLHSKGPFSDIFRVFRKRNTVKKKKKNKQRTYRFHGFFIAKHRTSMVQLTTSFIILEAGYLISTRFRDIIISVSGICAYKMHSKNCKNIYSLFPHKL